jgi:hypothetical protein
MEHIGWSDAVGYVASLLVFSVPSIQFSSCT